MRLWICKCGWRNPAHVAWCRGCNRWWERVLATHSDGRPSPKTRKRANVK